MNLKEYLLYNDDLDISKLYENLSRQLKSIHDKGLMVNNLNADSIIVSDEFSFDNMEPSYNLENDKRQNIIRLAKLMIGMILSKETGFRDFSNVENSWFVENLDNIFSVITEENMDKEYFESLFVKQENTYFSDYIDNKKNQEELEGKSNVQGYRKVLRNAASSLYQDASLEDMNDIKEKSALISTAFNPLLVGCAFAIITIIITFVLLII